MSFSLYVLRHGKAELEAPHGGDHERPLKKRGRAAAKNVGRFLTRIGEPPSLVLTSTAVRARDTAELASEAGAWQARTVAVRELYQSTPGDLLEQLRHTEPAVERLLVVGHEPTLSSLVALLTGGMPPAFPTGALARVEFELPSWAVLEARRGVLVWLVLPRILEPFLDEG